MSTEGLIISFIIAALTVMAVAIPLLRQDSQVIAAEERIEKHRDRLLWYYERILTNIRDLDEDHSTGKMPTADYEAEREIWVQRGMQILETLDNLQDQNLVQQTIQDQAGLDEAIDDAIEEAIQSYRTRYARE